MFSKNRYPIEINSEPQGADIVVKKQNGAILFQGTTPARPVLPAGDDLGKAFYNVTASMPGYKNTTTYIHYKVDGVYYVNLAFPIFGWFIGMTIIDPASGAMWKPSKSTINITLEKEN
ncbi:hypothetical protein D0T66_11615 [Dysgonomonas sp. 25]|nr:hypothetical protein [Dysgonomonas sp. 25]